MLKKFSSPNYQSSSTGLFDSLDNDEFQKQVSEIEHQVHKSRFHLEDKLFEKLKLPSQKME